MKTTRCTQCRTEFTKEEMEGANCCPACKTTSVPMSIDEDVTIKINIHELRILGIWAENHAVAVDNKNLDNPAHKSLKETVNLIAELIERQLTGSHPLTLSRELKSIQGSGQCGQVDLYRDGREEIL